jgi:alkylation response protein AidB-like acyl-CoA dehydrogenase
MGPSIIRFGNEEQKSRFLPQIARGEMSICIGYSEGDAGSDLAALQCSAEDRGDEFILNGHKMWNSAHQTDWMWTAVRTDPEAPKHKGISILLVELKLPGIEIVPQPLIDGSRKNIVNFHETRVSKEYLIGEKDQGWYVLAGNLDYERAGLEKVNSCLLLFRELVDTARKTMVNGHSLLDDPFVRTELANLSAEIEVGRLLCYRNAYQMSVGKVPNVEAAMSKCYNSELVQHLANVGLRVFGMRGTIGPDEQYSVLGGQLKRLWLRSIADTFAAGPGEIMRTVIATRGLGLPRK